LNYRSAHAHDKGAQQDCISLPHVHSICSPRAIASSEPLNKINGPQVRVSRQHPELSVPTDGGDFEQVETLLKEARYRLVTEVVKHKIV
jgi:hypothetical protein